MTSRNLAVSLAFASVIAPAMALAQAASELRGRVVDENGVGIVGATITLSSVAFAVRTDSSGAFVLTGTPGSTLVFRLRAAGYRDDTAAVTLPRRSRVTREFKLLSEATVLPEVNPSDRVLRGRVMDTEGTPLAYATIQVNGGRRYLSDDSGRVSIVPPPGGFVLLVRRIGFAPEEIRFDTAPDTAFRVHLAPVATALPEQRITGRAAFVSLDMSGFYRRMKDAERGINHGYFITPEDLEFRKPSVISQMAEGLPAVYMKRRGGDPRGDVIVGTPCSTPSKMCVPIGPSLFRCVMTVFLDRVRIVGRLGNVPDDALNELVLPTQVAAMEVYPRGVGAPPEFQPANGSCGVVLIWSK